LLKQKAAQKEAIILGYFILSKNHNEPPKVAAKNCPIWSSWLKVRLSPEIVSAEAIDMIHNNDRFWA
jgi:hypothetical protein